MTPLESAVVAMVLFSPFFILALSLAVLRRAGVRTEGQQ